MRAIVEKWLAARWYDGVAPGIGLRALAGIYRIASSRRRPVGDRPGVPVLVIGNFTVGGTGKTPLVIALARYFASRGSRPGIVSAGYGRLSTGPVRVELNTPVSECGDEPLLMRELTGVPVLVDKDRAAAARAAVAQGCDMVLADDGLQHTPLARDVEIEVVDGKRWYGNGLLLPAGPLRERPRKCDFRVVNGGDAAAGDWTMELVPANARRLDDSRTERPLKGFVGTTVNAVAAIGNPARFFDLLRREGLHVLEHAFEDHHPFTRADFERMTGPVLMTEKDAIKCRRLGLHDAWSVPVEACMPPDFFSAVARLLSQRGARHA